MTDTIEAVKTPAAPAKESKPTTPAKPKATRKPKVKANQETEMPLDFLTTVKLPNNAILTRKGDLIGKEGKQKPSGAHIVKVPTLKQLKALEQYKDKSDEELKQVIAQCEKDGKDLANNFHGRLQRDASWVFRSARMSEKSASIGFKRVIVQDLAYSWHLATGRPLAECRKELEKCKVKQLKAANTTEMGK